MRQSAVRQRPPVGLLERVEERKKGVNHLEFFTETERERGREGGKFQMGEQSLSRRCYRQSRYGDGE